MSLTNFKVISAEEMADRDAAQKLPPGCCPYVGAPQFNGATIRKCKICTTTACTPAAFTTSAGFNQCPSKREHEAYLALNLQKTTNAEGQV